MGERREQIVTRIPSSFSTRNFALEQNWAKGKKYSPRSSGSKDSTWNLMEFPGLDKIVHKMREEASKWKIVDCAWRKRLSVGSIGG